jgi:hypothetical protein
MKGSPHLLTWQLHLVVPPLARLLHPLLTLPFRVHLTPYLAIFRLRPPLRSVRSTLTTALSFVRPIQPIFHLFCWNHPQNAPGIRFDASYIVLVKVFVQITFVPV